MFPSNGSASAGGPRTNPISAPRRNSTHKRNDASSPPSNGNSPIANSPLGASPGTSNMKSRGTHMVPCKFYLMGKCSAGPGCQFLHESKQRLCEYNMKGQCKFGDRCANSHVMSGSPTTASRPRDIGPTPPPLAPVLSVPDVVKPMMRTSGFSPVPQDIGARSLPSGIPVKPMSDSDRVSPWTSSPQSSLFPHAGVPLIDSLSTRSPPTDDWLAPRRVEMAGSPLASLFGPFSTSAGGTPIAPMLSRSQEDRFRNLPPPIGTPPGRRGSYFSDIDLQMREREQSAHLREPSSDDDDVLSEINDLNLDRNRQYDPGYMLFDEDSPSNNWNEPPTGPTAPPPLSFADVAKANLPQSSQPSLPFEMHPRAGDEVCMVHARGECPYGSHCRNVHGLPCNLCGQRWIHPYNASVSQAHMESCQKRQQQRQAAGLAANPDLEEGGGECGICNDVIHLKKDARYGLLDCDHMFCLECVRKWRSTTGMDQSASHTCPICRTTTHLVVPSIEWAPNGPYKQQLIQAYKDSLRGIACRHFNQGRGTCPFGTSCLYKHALPDGTIEITNVRKFVDDEQTVRIMQKVLLSDFLDLR